MSDFLFRPPGSGDKLTPILERSRARTDLRVYEVGGWWGTVAFTESPYPGFSPVVTDDWVVVVAGGPALRFDVTHRPFRSRLYTEQVLQRHRSGEIRWQDDLSGPFAVLIVDRKIGAVTLVTDRFLMIPVYTGRAPDLELVGTGPDTINAALGRGAESLDPVSVSDFLLNGAITYPFTAYRDIEQLAPGSVYRKIPVDQTTQSRWRRTSHFTPDPSDRFASMRSAGRHVKRGLEADIDFHLARPGPVGAFQSAGEDSRLINGLLYERRIYDSLIFLSRENREGRTARRAAKRHGSSSRIAP